MKIGDKLIVVVYALLLLVGAFTILAYPIFSTLDGPEHLFYQETLGKLRHGDGFYSSQLYLKERIVPNAAFDELTGIFSNFLDPILAQKIVLFLTYIALNVAFLLLLLQLSNDKALMFGISCLFVPFTYTFVLIEGFVNFYIGLAFIAITLCLFIKALSSKSRYPVLLIILLALSTFLIYYSHLICWLMYCFLMVLYLSYDLIKAKLVEKRPFSSLDLRPLAIFFLSAIISVLFAIQYLYTLFLSRVRADSISKIFTNDISKSFLDRVFYSFGTIGYGYQSTFITLCICAILLMFILINITKAKSYKYHVLAAIFIAVFVSLPSVMLGWTYLKQRFWIPVVMLFLIIFSQIRISRKQRVMLVMFCVLGAGYLLYVTELEARDNYMSVKDIYADMNNIHIKDNSRVASFYHSPALSFHLIAYYCMQHHCLYQYTWFVEPDTFLGGYTKKMPWPLDGYGLNSSYLVYDYYFFEGDYYSNIDNVTSPLNLTQVYSSAYWRVYASNASREKG